MDGTRKRGLPLILACIILFLLTGCVQRDKSEAFVSETEASDITFSESMPTPTTKKEVVTEGTKRYRDFVIDNVLHSESYGDIHYNVYIPKSYDGNNPYALYFTLPGYEGLYFQGVAQNLKSEAFGFEAQKYNDEMIVVAPQLSDWGETSANQTITLVKYFLEIGRAHV